MMVKFDENQILKNGEYIYAQRAEIEKIVCLLLQVVHLL